MTSTPRVSIGLPVYNGEEFLAESIEALLGQTYEDFELIISDNASTDGTEGIYRRYAEQDSRIRFFRQSRNIGGAMNHNFVIQQAQGEFFKAAAHDDLYDRNLIARCVAVLDEDPSAVLALSWSALINEADEVTGVVNYPLNTGAPDVTERFRSMLFDGWGDDTGGIVRTDVLRQTPLHGSYHFADRIFSVQLALLGRFSIVPEYLYFRRSHAGQSGKAPDVRRRCANLDPRRANRLKNPVVRLYGEYIWGYISAIRRAPISAEEKARCYLLLTRWTGWRAMPVIFRTISRSGLRTDGFPQDQPPRELSVQKSVARAKQSEWGTM